MPTTSAYFVRTREIIEQAVTLAVEKTFEEEPDDPLAFMGSLLLSMAARKSGSNAAVSTHVTTRARAQSYAQREQAETDAMHGHGEPSRLEEEAAWLTSGLPPKDLRLQAAQAAISVLGPLTVEERHLEEQIKELQSAHDSCDGTTAELYRSRLEYLVRTKTASLQTTHEHLASAQARVDAVALDTARAIAPQLADDRAAYRRAIERLSDSEPGALDLLNERAAALINTGPLVTSSIVEIVHDGKLQRARVEGPLPSAGEGGNSVGGEGGNSVGGEGGNGVGGYSLSVWTELIYVSREYECE